MSGQHTSGPWAVHPLNVKFGGFVVPAEHVVRAIGGSTDAAADRDEFALKLCTISKDPHGRNNFEADARLIAAAPELLEALKEMVRMAEIEGWEGFGKAKAAISKATASTTDAGVAG